MRRHLICLMLACGLCGCADTPPPLDPPIPGSDHDAHGCIPSAGYAWCERTRMCEHPWTLAAREWFPTTKEAYEGYCGNAPQ